MKIDRLIGILSILLQQEKVTAPYLAEKFEVSRRTINRDIEVLCKAGIPLVTTQGAGGGISIMDGYRMDKTLLTSADMRAILAGLRSLDSVSGSNRYQQLMDKLSLENSSVLTSNQHIVIDLSSWYKNSLAPKIELIQRAIDRNELLSFSYYAPGGESIRTLEPYLLVFQWASWYVWGYCLSRQDYRMFKLNRMPEIKGTGEIFTPRQLPEFRIQNEEIFPAMIDVKALFEPEMKWRLIEEYGIDSFQKMEDGKLLFQFGFMDKESVFGWMLSFGDHAELLEPSDLRKELEQMLKRMQKKYKS
ncbi:YafY family transcriptional regulator [Faecalicatena sp. AGMB00832]|uniref:YafY family transcriptional regulator n=1 Tax=Faecalicatena faecalis TaxID=2726362 RepID=A0ABS6D1G4_9FIRM|nr:MULTISPECIES: YafY family protein [Faecalicatena]MBU3875354.1 YafY family transcriptional regulator [Faecalicatena faecalis]MCI6468088.1 YafY family transcriptional regulator [Faecalicatena sp.]MDY5618566.1 YafY family protein [Lachnospiraceae bacterium]